MQPNTKIKHLTPDKEKQSKMAKNATKIIEDSLIDAMPYIDAPTAQKLLGYSTAGTMKALRRMVDQKILKESEAKNTAGRKIKLFSLTPTARKTDDAKGIPNWTVKKFDARQQIHDTSLHLLRRDLINFYESYGITGVSFRQNYILKFGKTTRTSDLTLEYGTGQWPIEYERTLKSAVRYESILKICFHHFDRNRIAFMWIFDDANTAERFNKIVQKTNHYELRNAVDIFIWDQNATKPHAKLRTPYKIWGNPINPNPERNYSNHQRYLIDKAEQQKEIEASARQARWAEEERKKKQKEEEEAKKKEEEEALYWASPEGKRQAFKIKCVNSVISFLDGVIFLLEIVGTVIFKNPYFKWIYRKYSEKRKGIERFDFIFQAVIAPIAFLYIAILVYLKWFK
jgi:hypothetical protein